jgi:glycosyltransferase involved in cell wall biosynthesis
VETSSLSLLEGMSIGLPAVASNESGNPWVIKDGVNGLLFRSRERASLAERVALLYDSPELVSTLRSGALDVYKECFTCERFAKDIETTYMKIMEA